MFKKRFWIQILYKGKSEWLTIKRTASPERAFREWKALCGTNPNDEVRILDHEDKIVIADSRA